MRKRTPARDAPSRTAAKWSFIIFFTFTFCIVASPKQVTQRREVMGVERRLPCSSQLDQTHGHQHELRNKRIVRFGRKQRRALIVFESYLNHVARNDIQEINHV